MKKPYPFIAIATMVLLFVAYSCSKSSSKTSTPTKTISLQPLFSTRGKDTIFWTNTAATLYSGPNKTRPTVIPSNSEDLGTDGAFNLGEDIYFPDGTGGDLEEGYFNWTVNGNTLTVKYDDDTSLNTTATIESLTATTMVLYINSPIKLDNQNAVSYEETFIASSKP